MPVCGREGQGQDSLAAHFVLRNAASSVSEKSESGKKRAERNYSSIFRSKKFKLVGVRGFEPPAPCSQSRCATRLRHTPSLFRLPYLKSLVKKFYIVLTSSYK